MIWKSLLGGLYQFTLLFLDDMLYPIHLFNTKASVTVKTPMGDTHPLLLSNLVKQGTVFGPVLNNCSLDRFSQESFSYQFGLVK